MAVGQRWQTRSLFRRYYDIASVARYLSLSTWTVRRLIWSGKLPAIRLNRALRIDIRDVDGMMEANKEGAGCEKP